MIENMTVRLTSESGALWSSSALGCSRAISKGISMQHVYHSHSCATLIEIHIDILLKLFMEASCCCSKQEAVICWYVGILVYPFLQRFCLIFVSPTPLSLVHFCCLCMISVLHSPLYLPPASPQPSISRSLYRNRSFLRIPLAARPRFSSLRSLRFVLPHSAKVKGMPSPPYPSPPQVHVVHMLQCSSTEEQSSPVHFTCTIWNAEENLWCFSPQEHGLIFMIASYLHATELVPSENKSKDRPD